MTNQQKSATATGDVQQVRVRKAPKYGTFVILGGLLGAIAAIVVGAGNPVTDEFDAGQVVAFLAMVFVGIGLGMGALVALILDRLLARRARTLNAQHSSGVIPEPESTTR